MKFLTLAMIMTAAASVVEGAKYPGKTWERSTPEDQGMSSEKLEEAFAYAGVNSFCASVHRNGYLVKDAHWRSDSEVDNKIVWSVSKAITSTLFGIAESEGKLTTYDLASQYISEWRSPNEAANITIDHLLRHDSGRWYDPLSDFIFSQFQRSQTSYAIGLRQFKEPGTLYRYNQMAFQTLERVLEVSLNETVPEYINRKLLVPLGFEAESFYMEKSVLIPMPNDPILYGGFHTSCHDLARFGTLWLNRGRWEGDVPFFDDEFYERATNMPPAPRPGQRYHWTGPPNYRATGMGDQMVVFNPEKNLIITRLGGAVGVAFSASKFVDLVMQSFLDEDMGTWDYERDQVENPPRMEEVQLAQFLEKAGVEVLPNGEIRPLDLSGWFELVNKE